jgi:hypothetical protein
LKSSGNPFISSDLSHLYPAGAALLAIPVVGFAGLIAHRAGWVPGAAGPIGMFAGLLLCFAVLAWQRGFITSKIRLALESHGFEVHQPPSGGKAWDTGADFSPIGPLLGQLVRVHWTATKAVGGAKVFAAGCRRAGRGTSACPFESFTGFQVHLDANCREMLVLKGPTQKLCKDILQPSQLRPISNVQGDISAFGVDGEKEQVPPPMMSGIALVNAEQVWYVVGDLLVGLVNREVTIEGAHHVEGYISGILSGVALLRMNSDEVGAGRA